MKLKSKIFTTIVILIIIPIALALVSVYVITNYQAMQMQSQYGIDLSTTQSIANPMIILDWLTSSTYDELKEVSVEDPDKFFDKEYLEEVNSKMNTNYSFLVIRIEDNFKYIGDKSRFKKIDYKDFPSYDGNIGDEKEYEAPIVYLGGSYPCLLKQQDFVSSNGEKGSAFIVINVNRVLPEIKSLAIQCVCVFVIILLITTVVLVTWIYKSILRPLNELSRATRRISGGDLDFTIDYKNDDELGALCNDFEYMRKQLKELIDNQQLYEKESRELISNISHDLKTPLTAIKGYAEGLMDGVADTKEKQKKYLRTIYTKANAMTALVDELSLYSKVEGNKVMYEFISINIDRYFNDCVEELTLDVEVKGIALEYINDCDKDINVIIDGEQVKRVINNVVNNAVKYIDNKANGIIQVILSDKDRFVQVEIKDNGKGIEKEDTALIFDRFYRTDASRNSAQGGTGLGLSIAKKIIEDHCGKIYAKSGEGKGTSIIFTLPKENNCTEKTDKKVLKRSKYNFKINNFGRKNK